MWGQLPLLARLQVLAVGAELPAGGGECKAEPAVLPYDWLEGGVPDGIMDCRWDSEGWLQLVACTTAVAGLCSRRQGAGRSTAVRLGGMACANPKQLPGLQRCKPTTPLRHSILISYSSQLADAPGAAGGADPAAGAGAWPAAAPGLSGPHPLHCGGAAALLVLPPAGGQAGQGGDCWARDGWLGRTATRGPVQRAGLADPVGLGQQMLQAFSSVPPWLHSLAPTEPDPPGAERRGAGGRPLAPRVCSAAQPAVAGAAGLPPGGAARLCGVAAGADQLGPGGQPPG